MIYFDLHGRSNQHSLLLWCFTNATFQSSDVLPLQNFVPLMFHYCNISSWWHFTTATFHPCDIFTTIFHPVTFYYYNISIPIWCGQVTDVDPLLRPTSCHCMDFGRMSSLALKEMWTFCQKSPGHTRRCFRLVGRRVDKMSQRPKFRVLTTFYPFRRIYSDLVQLLIQGNKNVLELSRNSSRRFLAKF
jgi:hypothetical protein